MEKLNEAIKNYIDSDELFALFIDGQWGVGKTYYIKNKILKEFDDKIEIRYISLYGLQNLYEIKSIIISKLINTSTKNLRKVLKSMKNFQVVPYLNMNNFSDNILRYIDDNSLKKIKYSLMKNNKSALLIIDDVERMSDKVSFEEFLGFIRNDLIDYLDCKVLFIGNLDELNKKADFHKNSEKIISRILKFPNNREVAMDIVNSNLPELFVKNISSKELFNGFFDISDEKKEIIFEKSKQNNLNYKYYHLNMRTLNLVVSNFKLIINKMQDEIKYKSKDFKITLYISLFISLFILYNEFRSGNLNESEIKDLQFTYNDFNNLNTKTSIALFKYLYKNNELANYVFFDIELKNLLLYGIFDESIFLKNITNNFKEEDAKADLLNVLKEFFKLSEIELLEKEIQAIEIIKDKNNENFNYKVKAYLSLLNLKGKNLYLIDDIKISELEDELVDNYDLHQNNLIVGDTINRLDLVSFSNEQLYEEIKSLKDRLINKRTTLMTSIYNQYLETILNGDFTNRTKLKEAYIGTKDIDTIEIIYNNLNKVSNELKSSNEKIINLSAFIKDNHCNYNDNIQLEYIIGEMKKLKDGTKDRVTQMCFSLLIDTLKDIIDE
ncbi:TPA: NTPase [Staphylococcus aureus]|uniref:NTPase n=1 Tax=Staphylococcus aureus TaxID=1280 RepID=UPI001B33EC9F|nr:NTPase [Staphylococcus aureus]MCS4773679.1 NTPase [Staphylococcus aureus]MDI1954485.1 NTPase [Staphylococcus aureus]HDF8239055.1 NTPase [Staphylococcus aureus]